MSAAMKIDLPAPPIPADADLRHFQTMPLDVQRFRDSDLCCVEDPEVRWANVMSWSVAWHQLPAGSLPDDDVALCRLLGYGSQVKKWRRLRANGALRGWVLCSDGRLYHPVVTEMALDCVGKSKAQAKKARQRWSPAKPQAADIPQNPECHGNASPEEPAIPLKGIEGNRRDIPPTPVTGGIDDLFPDDGAPAPARPNPEPEPSADDERLLEVLRVWNEEAHPNAPQVKSLGDDTRRRDVAELLNRAGSLENVRQLFAWVAANNGLTGGGSKGFVARFGWTIRREQVTQFSEEAGLEFGPAKQRRRAGR